MTLRNLYISEISYWFQVGANWFIFSRAVSEHTHTHVSEIRPPTCLLFIPYDYGGPQWNYIEREIPKKSEMNLPQCHFVHHKSHIDLHEAGPPMNTIKWMGNV
jgi:hypothetical protein